MYEDTLDVNISPAYNAGEFIDDLKAELASEIEALIIRSQSDKMTALEGKLKPEIALERIAIVKEIMQRLNLS